MTETIAEHLTAVDAALGTSGLAPAARAGVLADLEAHIDALRAEGRDDAAILAALDPPSDYGPAAELAGAPVEGAAVARPASGSSPLGRLSLGLAVGGLLAGVAVGFVGSALGRDAAHGGYVLFFGCQLAAIAIGVADWRAPVARAGGLTGAALLGVSLLL